MIVKEFRVILPLTVPEYQVAQLYSVAEASKNETGGGEGVEVLANQPYKDHPLLDGKFDKGQYTHKIYHIDQKLPRFLRILAPKSVLTFHEKAWNAYPYCRTVISNPDYMKENFELKIETMHLADRGKTHNAHQLSDDMLKRREVITINIADNSQISKSDYKEECDPSKFHSVKTGRGPLNGNWMETVEPVMCCYKLVTGTFKWLGLQNRVESFLMDVEKRLFTNFHRELFCWMDRWHGLDMKDIRALEEKTKAELDRKRMEGAVTGTAASE